MTRCSQSWKNKLVGQDGQNGRLPNESSPNETAQVENYLINYVPPKGKAFPGFATDAKQTVSYTLQSHSKMVSWRKSYCTGIFFTVNGWSWHVRHLWSSAPSNIALGLCKGCCWKGSYCIVSVHPQLQNFNNTLGTNCTQKEKGNSKKRPPSKRGFVNGVPWLKNWLRSHKKTHIKLTNC